MKHLGDITKIDGSRIPIVDCITGGSPCQDLSVAGNREGLKGERSGLFMEQIRIVKEMRKHDREENGKTNINVRPRFMVWENVPGAFSSNEGKDFQAVLSEIVRIAEADAPDVPMPEKGKWTKAGALYDEMGGWSIAWRVHDAQFWGTAQRRKRIAVVADFNGLCAAEVLFEREGLRGYFEQGEETRGGFANTVRRSANETGGPISYGFEPGHSQRLSFNFSEEKSPCLRANMGDNQASAAIFGQSSFGGFSESVAMLKAKGGDYGGGSENLCVFGTDVVGAIYSEDHRGANNGFVSQNKLRITGTGVRRLTPLECERLQGFPDGWTDIGEWTDTKGKIHKESSDAARYKALGNSIAVGYANNASGFWCWLLKRISAQYERNATLGSLFDGIGGFPLAWEHYNGKGSAVWASEIEEFPIAVTKRRFGGE